MALDIPQGEGGRANTEDGEARRKVIAIKRRQRRLVRNGYLPEGSADGIWGPKSKKAWRQFVKNDKKPRTVTPGTAGSTGGGGGGGGSTGGGGGHDHGGEEADTRSVVEKARELYPQFAVFLDIPGVGPILREAAREGWSQDRLRGALQETNWWKRTADTTRRWDYLAKTDPRTAEQRIDMKAQELWQYGIQNLGTAEISIDEMKVLAKRGLRWGWTDSQFEKAIRSHKDFVDRSESEREYIALSMLDRKELQNRLRKASTNIRDMAGRLGVQVNAQTIAQVSHRTLKDGLTEEQLRRRLVDEMDWSNTHRLDGEAAQIWEQLGRTQSDYLMRIGEKQRKKWAKRIMAGDDTIDGFVDYARDYARSRFPSLQGALERGLTVQEFAEPYRQIVAETLEVSPQDVDFFKDKYAKLLEGKQDEKGNVMPMALHEAGRYLRGLSEYQNTDNARRQAADLSTQLLKSFGAMA